MIYFRLRFGTKTPTDFLNKSFSLVELQEKAKTFLTASPNSTAVDNAVHLYQLIEDFCRETDRYMETEKKNNDDLQSQVSLVFLLLFRRRSAEDFSQQALEDFVENVEKDGCDDSQGQVNVD